MPERDPTEITTDDPTAPAADSAPTGTPFPLLPAPRGGGKWKHLPTGVVLALGTTLMSVAVADAVVNAPEGWDTVGYSRALALEHAALSPEERANSSYIHESLLEKHLTDAELSEMRYSDYLYRSDNPDVGPPAETEALYLEAEAPLPLEDVPATDVDATDAATKPLSAFFDTVESGAWEKMKSAFLVSAGITLVLTALLSVLIFIHARRQKEIVVPAPHQERLRTARKRADAVMDAYTTCLFDPLEAVRRPALFDLEVPQTQEFTLAYNNLTALSWEGDGVDLEHLEEVVSRAELFWDRARSHATRVTTSYFSLEEQKRLAQAEQLLKLALDESATGPERRLASERALALLQGIVVLHPSARQSITSSVGPALAASPSTAEAAAVLA